MDIRYYEEEKFLHLELYGDSDRTIFQLIADELSKTFNVEWKEKINGFDQRYWDFKYGGFILTLHLEHYLGISIHTQKTGDNKSAQQILEEIGNHFKTWNPPGSS